MDEAVDNPIIGDAPCPRCRSEGRDKTGNHLMIFQNGTAYCNRCSYQDSAYTPDEESKEDQQIESQSSSQLEEIKDLPFSQLTDRLISKDTCKHYGVKVSLSQEDGETVTHHYYPIYKEDNISAYKIRKVSDKSFKIIGDSKDCQFFGQSTVTPGGKKIYITEGEIDCMTLFQCLKERMSKGYEDINPPVISLPHGSSSAKKYLQLHYEFINSFDQIVFVYDNDEAGKEAAKESCQLFPTKSFYVNLPLKDPSDMYLSGKGNDLKWLCVKDCIKYKSERIINDPEELWEFYQENKARDFIPYPFPKLNEMIYGLKLGTVTTITSGTGMGKSQIMRELKDHFFRTTNYKMADIALEETVGDTISGMMSLYLNKRIHLPDSEYTEAEEREAFNYYYKSGRFSLYDQKTGLDDSGLFSKIEEFAKTDHKIIFLDHLTMVVEEFDSKKGERERLNLVMNKLERMAKDLGVAIVLVVHLRKCTKLGESFEQGSVPSLDDLKGSSAIKQCSAVVLGLSRNQQHPDKTCANTSLITVLKERNGGNTGPSDYLYFDNKTGRMYPTPKPVNYEV